jgi:LysM repeat protein
MKNFAKLKARPNQSGILCILSLLLVMVNSACSGSQPLTTPGNTASLPLTPYWTVTPTPTLEPTKSQDQALATQTPRPTIPPPPTPTPFTYEVKKGDTLLSIAFQHGVTLDELQLANPDVDARWLSVGTKLIIPITEAQDESGTPQAIPTPTPVAVLVKSPDCYASAEGGRWCFIPVVNTGSGAVENLSAWVNLSDSAGEVITGTVAIPPLNAIPEDQSLPLYVFFPSEWLQDVQPPISASVELLSAYPGVNIENRYFRTQVQVDQTRIDPSGNSVVVEGSLEYSPYAIPTLEATQSLSPTVTASPTPAVTATPRPQHAASLWVVAVAYGEDGSVVGLRKWEVQDIPGPGEALPFEMRVFSLGPAIARVEVLAEAR